MTKPSQTWSSLRKRLAAERIKRGQSKAQLSALVGVSPQALGQWEDGTTAPVLTNAVCWAHSLGLRLEVVADD